VPKIEPFRGVHYDPMRTYGLSPVIGPPQDLPDLGEAARLIEQHPFHSLRLELGDPDVNGWTSPERVRESVYQRWIDDGVLIKQPEPVFFVHEHRYRQDGIYHRRLGLFATAEISDDPVSGFRPHESTIRENLRFRVDLLRHLRLSISPIFTIVRDSGWLGVVLAELVHARPPDLSGHDAEEGIHRLWTMDDPYLITWLQELVSDRPLYIADGHHRYAAAKAYRDHLLQEGRDPGNARTVLTLIVSEFDPGVSVLPIHREVRKLPGDWNEIEARFNEVFRIDCVLTEEQIEPELVQRRATRLAETIDDEPAFLMMRHPSRQLEHVRVRHPALIDQLIDASVPDVVRNLDVTVLHRMLLENVFGIPEDDPEGCVNYSPDAAAIVRRVQSGASELGLFMRNPRVEQVMAVADAGAHMPQKSTYFYPKVPAGLVMYDLEG
jgi:uncharacterized protein (DUF1015 family)